TTTQDRRPPTNLLRRRPGGGAAATSSPSRGTPDRMPRCPPPRSDEQRQAWVGGYCPTGRGADEPHVVGKVGRSPGHRSPGEELVENRRGGLQAAGRGNGRRTDGI